LVCALLRTWVRFPSPPPKIAAEKDKLTTELTKRCGEAEKELCDLLPDPIANDPTRDLKNKVRYAHDILVEDIAKIIGQETQKKLNDHDVKIKEWSERIETFEKNQ